MIRQTMKRCAIAFLPFFAIWLLVAMSLARDRFSAVLTGSLISMGCADLLGTRKQQALLSYFGPPVNIMRLRNESRRAILRLSYFLWEQLCQIHI
jgi:hypothetical protein